MLLLEIFAAQVKITFNVKSQNGSPLKSQKVNFLVNATNFYVETDAKGLATYTTENGSAFPAQHLFAYQVVDPTGTYNTVVRQTVIHPSKVMIIEVRMVEKMRLNVTVMDKNASSWAHNQRFKLYLGSSYYGTVETNVQGFFSITSGQNGVYFAKGSEVRVVADDHALYKDKSCIYYPKFADQAVECVMEQHPLRTLTVNTVGSGTTDVSIFQLAQPIFQGTTSKYQVSFSQKQRTPTLIPGQTYYYQAVAAGFARMHGAFVYQINGSINIQMTSANVYTPYAAYQLVTLTDWGRQALNNTTAIFRQGNTTIVGIAEKDGKIYFYDAPEHKIVFAQPATITYVSPFFENKTFNLTKVLQNSLEIHFVTPCQIIKLQFRTFGNGQIRNVNYNLTTSEGQLIQGGVSEYSDEIVFVPTKLYRPNANYTLRCIQVQQDYQGTQMQFSGQLQTFAQPVIMPYMPKVNVAAKARKNGALISGLEVAAASAQEQIFSLVTHNGVVNYTSNKPNKIVANDKITVFCNDPANKYPSIGFVATANNFYVAGGDFVLDEIVALTAQFTFKNRPAANIDVNVSVGAEKRSLKTNAQGKIVVSSQLIAVQANDSVMFEVDSSQFQRFQQNISFPAASASIVFELEAGDDAVINVNVQTGATCKESNVVLNAKNHIFKGTTQNCSISFSSPADSRWLVEGETYQYVVAALGFAEARGSVVFAQNNMTVYISLLSEVQVMIRFVDNVVADEVAGVTVKVFMGDIEIQSSQTDFRGWIYITNGNVKKGVTLRLVAVENTKYKGGEFNLQITDLKQKAAFQLQKK